MATIADIRQQFPQYNDLSDQQLADKMYAAHYSDMPRAQFDQKIGLNAQRGPQPTVGDQIIASPMGRLFHDIVQQPLTSVESLLSDNNKWTLYPQKQPPGSTILGSLMAKDANNAEANYQASLAANRNTPGYQAALQQAQATQAHNPSLGGFQAQATAPFNPGMAGLLGLVTGGLDQANANADVQSQAQAAYQRQHPLLAAASQTIGGLAATPENVNSTQLLESTKPPEIYIPTLDDLKSTSQAAYNKVDNAGIGISSDAMNRLADRITDNIGPRLDPTLHPDATAALNRVMQYGTEGVKGAQPASFTDLDNLRRVVADAAQATKPADRAMAYRILDNIDDFVDNLRPADLDTTAQDAARSELLAATSQKGQIAKEIKSIEQNSPGALISRGAAGADTRARYLDLHQRLQNIEASRQAALGGFQDETALLNAGPQDTINALNDARDAWSRYKQATLIQDNINKAGIKASANYSQSGMENALRQQFKSLALNDRAMSRLSPEVQKAVKQVAAGSPTANVLRAIGKYAPHGPVATVAGMGVGSILGGIPGAAGGGLASLAVPMVGEAARAGATAMTKAAAQRAMDLAAVGSRQAPMLINSAPMFQAPAITAQSRLPLGLLGSGLLAQAQPAQ